MVKKATKNTIGVFSISIGLLFGVLPFVPGILLILVGLELLGLREATIDRLKQLFGRNKAETKETVTPVITPDVV